MDFQNRVALVTGGTGALGSAVALDLLATGARVAVTYRSSAEWETLKHRAAEHSGCLVGFHGQVTVGEEVERIASDLVARWECVDFLVAVAGGFPTGKSYETDERTWDTCST